MTKFKKIRPTPLLIFTPITMLVCAYGIFTDNMNWILLITCLGIVEFCKAYEGKTNDR